MKHIWNALLLLIGWTVVFPMEEVNHSMITLPSKEVLLERLHHIKEYEHFLINSPFIGKFAHTKSFTPHIFADLGFHIDAYRERFKDDKKVFQLEMLKPKVVTLMLQDNLAAIAYLKQEKVLAESVLLPSVDILRTCLVTAGFAHFASTSSIVKQLADQQKYPTEIYMIVVLEMDEYTKQLQSKKIARQLQRLIPVCARVILQKHPQALQFLIDEELLQ